MLIYDIVTLRQQVAKWHKQRNVRVALIPTMGCLHAGHMSLIKVARQAADIVIVSIFINPLQFAIGEDLSTYPRTLTADIALCNEYNVDAIFAPQDMEQLTPLAYGGVAIKAGTMANCLCGQSRLGHFDGVLTIVNILLHLVQADVAVFGEKDFQQLQLIRQMINDFHMPVQVLAAPLLRDNNGLALSSRNSYLSPAEKKQALALSQALFIIRDLAQQQHNNNIAALLSAGFTVLAKHDVCAQYLEIRDSNLHLVQHLTDDCRAFIAANIGDTRLIDNINITMK